MGRFAARALAALAASLQSVGFHREIALVDVFRHPGDELREEPLVADRQRHAGAAGARVDRVVRRHEDARAFRDPGEAASRLDRADGPERGRQLRLADARAAADREGA